MRRILLIRSIVATLFGLSAAAVGAVAAPAVAAADGPCCQVALNGLPGQFHAGAGAERFQVWVKNTGNNPLGAVTVTLSFKAGSLNRNQVHVEYEHNGSWRSVGTREQNGMIAATSSPNSDFFKHNNIAPGQSVGFPYRVAFGGKVPSQPLSVWLTVAPGWRGGQAAQAGPYQSAIVGIGAASTPTNTASATPTPTISDTTAATPDATTSDGIGVGAAPTELGGSSGSDSGSGLAWLAYTIGALLLLAGIGVIGTMLWRRGPQPVETDWVDPDPYQQVAHPTAAHPAAAHPTAAHPTAMYPNSGYDPYQPPAQGTPTVYGTPATPTTRFPAPQDPYADETRLDLR